MPSGLKFVASTLPIALIATGILLIVRSQDKQKKSGGLSIGITLLILGALWLLGIIKMPI